MPSEREHLALSALLEALPEPVLSVDEKQSGYGEPGELLTFSGKN
ncbi:hypothetical protein ACLB1M_11925 [Escherichia coli]